MGLGLQNDRVMVMWIKQSWIKGKWSFWVCIKCVWIKLLSHGSPKLLSLCSLLRKGSGWHHHEGRTNHKTAAIDHKTLAGYKSNGFLWRGQLSLNGWTCLSGILEAPPMSVTRRKAILGSLFWGEVICPFFKKAYGCKKHSSRPRVGITVVSFILYDVCLWFVALCFLQRPAHGFQTDMKLEAVDKRNPMLIRVATITDKDDYRLKVGIWFHQAIVLLCLIGEAKK